MKRIHIYIRVSPQVDYPTSQLHVEIPGYVTLIKGQLFLLHNYKCIIFVMEFYCIYSTEIAIFYTITVYKNNRYWSH